MCFLLLAADDGMRAASTVRFQTSPANIDYSRGVLVFPQKKDRRLQQTYPTPSTTAARSDSNFIYLVFPRHSQSVHYPSAIDYPAEPIQLLLSIYLLYPTLASSPLSLLPLSPPSRVLPKLHLKCSSPPVKVRNPLLPRLLRLAYRPPLSLSLSLSLYQKQKLITV